MTPASHIDALIDDYVLRLLPARVRRDVEAHAGRCDRCRDLLMAERNRTGALARALEETLAPAPGRLEAMWPAVARRSGFRRQPAARSQTGSWLRWRAALVLFAVSLLLLGGLLSHTWGIDGWLNVPKSPSATAQTASPTASATPTWIRPSHTADAIACAYTAQGASPWPESGPIAMALTVTPEPPIGHDVPVPEPNPSAPIEAAR